MGNAIGIAIVIAMLGNPKGPQALADFQRAWVAMAVGALSTAVAMLLVEPRRASDERQFGDACEPNRQARS
jgi:hypothetical protein